LGNLPSAILWTWPYHVTWFCSISFIIASSSPICCLIVTTFLILSFLDIIVDTVHSPYVKVLDFPRISLWIWQEQTSVFCSQEYIYLH
jgi:hypothetical protein